MIIWIEERVSRSALPWIMFRTSWHEGIYRDYMLGYHMFLSIHNPWGLGKPVWHNSCSKAAPSHLTGTLVKPLCPTSYQFKCFHDRVLPNYWHQLGSPSCLLMTSFSRPTAETQHQGVSEQRTALPNHLPANMGQTHHTEQNDPEIDVKALQDMYKKFVTECPSGVLFIHEFKRFFGVDPTGEVSEYAESMFRAFDKNGVR